ncbi:MAG: PKD domain-containing protein [Deltaproteobacteria bacterium]|nr:PKD domain-containing protein [Deltaproteobacteria bacterium]
MSTAGSTDSDGTIVATTLDFGDNVLVSATPATHVYEAAGTYTITAIVTDDDGATATVSTNVTVTGTGVGPLTPSLVASRTSGFAPLAVHFDATGASSTTPGVSDLAQGGAFRQIRHAFNFGDPASGNHALSGLNRNTEPFGGGLAAHVFRAPGIYTVTVTSTDGVAPAVIATVMITVDDPALLPAIAISRTGDFTGAPLGATQLTRTTLPVLASNSRYFFRRGEDWGAAELLVSDPLTNVHIDAFGPGDDPVFRRVGVGTARPETGVFVSDVRVSHVTAREGLAQETGSRILFDACTSLAPMSGSGLAYAPIDPWRNVPQEGFENAEEIYFVGCRLIGDGTPTGYMWFGNGSRLVFLDTAFGGTAQGTVRVTAWDRGVMRHCELASPWTDSSVHALKAHAGGPNLYTRNWVASGSVNTNTSNSVNWMTSRLVIANNVFGAGPGHAAWTVAVCPQNDAYGANGWEPLADVIIENNTFVDSPSTSLDVAWRGRRFTSRGNVMSPANSGLTTGGGHSQAVQYDGPYFSQ